MSCFQRLCFFSEIMILWLFCWLRPDCIIAHALLSHLHKSGSAGPDGGVALIYSGLLWCSLISFGNFSSYTILTFPINGNNFILCLVLYQHSKCSKTFKTEVSKLGTTFYYCQVWPVHHIWWLKYHSCCARRVWQFLVLLILLDISLVLHITKLIWKMSK